MPYSSFWKIEAQNYESGGQVIWEKFYYIRHFLTGQYLELNVLTGKLELN